MLATFLDMEAGLTSFFRAVENNFCFLTKNVYYLTKMIFTKMLISLHKSNKIALKTAQRYIALSA